MKWITLCFLALFGACTPNTMDNPYKCAKIQGKIIEKRYYDPTGTFSIATLDSPFNPIVYDFPLTANSSLGVIFQDDIGLLIRVEVYPGSKNKVKDLMNESDSLNFAFEFVYDSIVALFPGTKVEEKMEVELDGIGKAYAGILFIPHGSTLTDAETGIREDSRRSFVVSYAEEDLVIISVQENGLLSNFRKIRGDPTPTPEEDKRLINSAIEARKSYQKLK